jgi:hypothetical protein
MITVAPKNSLGIGIAKKAKAAALQAAETSLNLPSLPSIIPS